MKAYIHIAGVVVAGTVLSGCATTTAPASATVAKDPSCLTDTGSRIAVGPGQCRGFGRSYSSQDIDKTGLTSAAGALSLLDSSVTVHH